MGPAAAGKIFPDGGSRLFRRRGITAAGCAALSAVRLAATACAHVVFKTQTSGRRSAVGKLELAERKIPGHEQGALDCSRRETQYADRARRPSVRSGVEQAPARPLRLSVSP